MTSKLQKYFSCLIYKYEFSKTRLGYIHENVYSEQWSGESITMLKYLLIERLCFI